MCITNPIIYVCITNPIIYMCITNPTIYMCITNPIYMCIVCNIYGIMQLHISGVHCICVYADATVASVHATSLLSLLPLKGRQSIDGFQRVNMSSLSTSYSNTESSTSSHSSSDESVE